MRHLFRRTRTFDMWNVVPVAQRSTGTIVGEIRQLKQAKGWKRERQQYQFTPNEYGRSLPLWPAHGYTLKGIMHELDRFAKCVGNPPTQSSTES